jgi:hypothetical protein
MIDQLNETLKLYLEDYLKKKPCGNRALIVLDEG